uniref:RNA methyltransferase, putative n=1 Tax=Theileria annulata TaxID=5874 RepID=A0A3B0MU09_THEAN
MLLIISVLLSGSHTGIFYPLFIFFREGVVRLIRKDSSHKTLYADCGVFSSVKIHNKEDLQEFYGIDYMTDEEYDVYQRVTIRLDDESIAKCRRNFKQGKSLSQNETGPLSANLVHPEEPLKVAGLYWGYVVRECKTVVESLKGCPFNESGNYDLKIGTCERGELYSLNTKLPKFKNMLIHFGPVLGLEHVMEEPENKFDKYFNFCNQQKSRTIRTEEALLIVLSILSFTNKL